MVKLVSDAIMYLPEELSKPSVKGESLVPLDYLWKNEEIILKLIVSKKGNRTSRFEKSPAYPYCKE